MSAAQREQKMRPVRHVVLGKAEFLKSLRAMHLLLKSLRTRTTADDQPLLLEQERADAANPPP